MDVDLGRWSSTERRGIRQAALNSVCASASSENNTNQECEFELHWSASYFDSCIVPLVRLPPRNMSLESTTRHFRR
jgi:hypothetical protein